MVASEEVEVGQSYPLEVAVEEQNHSLVLAELHKEKAAVVAVLNYSLEAVVQSY